MQDADAEDIAQETLAEFIRACRAGKYQRSRSTRPRDWLKGIAANRVREFRRRMGRSREHQGPPAEGETDFFLRITDEAADNTWDEEWTAHLLSLYLGAVRVEFDPKTVRVFEQYGIRQRPAHEVARDFGMTANAVYIAKSRVLGRLQSLMADLDAPIGSSL